MKKIEQLTPEQRARFPEFVDRWTKVGLCTKPADKPAAERAIKMMYEAAKLKPPEKIIWCSSPSAIAKSFKEMTGKKLDVSQFVYGQHDASWLSFYSYMDEVLGLREQVQPLDGLRLLAESAGWALPFEEACWVSDRPEVVQLDTRGRLHNTEGPALRFRDGWAIYAVHGVRVKPEIVEEQDKITVEAIDKEANVEVRRVMIELFGADRYVRSGKLVDESAWGRLWQREVPGDEAVMMVEVLNSTPEPDGTIKTYFLRVDPQCRPLMSNNQRGEPQKPTALNAIASTFGKTGAEYAPLVQT